MSKFKEVVAVTFWGAVAFGFLCLAIHLVELWHRTTALGWDRVPCTIEKFDVSIDPKGYHGSLKIDLEYRYQADGKEWTGTRWQPKGNRSDTYEEISDHLHELTGELPTAGLDLKGRTVFCRVDEDDFSRSALVPDRQRFVSECSFAGAALLLVVGVVALTRKANPEGPLDLLPVAFVFAFLFVGLGAIAFSVWKLSDYFAMQKWVDAPATVVASHSQSSPGSMKPRIHFRYQHAGREYLASRIDVLEDSVKRGRRRRNSASRSKRTSELLAAYPPGKQFTAFVDPAKPWHAVIDRSASGLVSLAVFAGGFTAFGGGMLWLLLRKPGKGKPDKARKRNAKRQRKRS